MSDPKKRGVTAKATPQDLGGCDGAASRRAQTMRRPHKESKSLFELLLAQDRRMGRPPHHSDLEGPQREMFRSPDIGFKGRR